MIFLGAGAFKELDIPTLKGLSYEIFTELDELGYRPLIIQITNSLEEFGIKPDFEAIYSILEALQSPLESIKKAGPLRAVQRWCVWLKSRAREI